MSNLARALLNERRKRAIATVLNHCETKVYPRLSPDAQGQLRAKVIAAISEYHDTVVDVVKALAAEADDGMLRNEEVLRLIARIERHLATQDA